jgi:hypothetical protein
MPDSSLDLAVIESRWWKSGNSSVKGTFDVLSDILTRNPSAYHYEMFNNSGSFGEVFRRIANSRIRNVYIGAHGTETKIFGANGLAENAVSRTKIRNVLREIRAKRGSALHGIYFGCCLLAQEDTIEFLLEPEANHHVRVRWVAGYGSSVDWIKAAAVDLFFWNTYYRLKRRRKTGQTEMDLISKVAEHLNTFMPGAHKELKLNIFTRKQRVGGIKNLLEEED